jgi:MFS family permease
MPPRTPFLRASVRDRRFAVLLFAVALNSIGSWASAIALWGAGVYRFHAGPSALSLLIVCWAAPPILLAPPAGVLVDRIGPRRSLVIAYLCGAVTACCLAFAGSLIVMAILAAASGVGRALAAPAGGALPPRLVEPKDLVAANSWLGATGQMGQVCGPLVSSLLLATAGFPSAFLVDAATFLIGVAALVLLPAAGVRHRHRTTIGRELTEGLRIVARHSTLQALVVVGAAASFTSGAYLVVEPLYAQRVLGRPASQFALFEAAAGLGAVAGSMLAMRLGGRLLRAAAVSSAAIAYGAAAAVFVGTRWLAVAYAGAFLWGVSAAVFGVASISVLQRLAPDHARGRVLALASGVWTFCETVGPLLAGGLVAGLTVQRGAIVLAGISVAGGLVGVSAGVLRRAPASD